MARQMKDSGIEWIGEIPETWEVTKAKFILSANDGGVWGNDPADDGNDKIVIRSTEQTIDGRWCIEAPAVRDLSTVPHASSRILPGDLLITKSSGSDLHIGKTTLADEYFEANECYFSNFIQRIRCKGYLPRLLWYLFNSNIVREQFVYLQNTTSGIGNINADIIDNLFLPNPPLTMQHRIAAFLDHKCAEIDAVIERTKATIEEYKKLKQAVITEAVTKGVRGPRPMKDSGIEWIGEIPEEWSVGQLGKYVSVHNGDRSSNYPVPEELLSEGIPFFTSFDIGADEVEMHPNAKYLSREKYLSLAGYKAEIGDIVFCLRGSVGKCALNLRYEEGTVASSLMGIRCESILGKFAFYVLVSSIVAVQNDLLMNGTCAANLSAKNVCKYRITVPTEKEQVEIAAYLDEKCAALDTLSAKKTALLTELETYKKSLIYEYVTGKKEVL